MSVITQFLSKILLYCDQITGNYGWAIVLFTFLTKVMLIPVSVWIQKNSIKLVRMQPEVNEIKARHYGDKDTIAEKLSDIYKREGYNAFASTIPMIIQVVLLIAIISAIRDGLAQSQVNPLFCGISIDKIPYTSKGLYYLIPLVAAVSSYVLCRVQDRSNVIQSNSSGFERYLTMIISIGIALVFGFLVQVGVVIYWVFSNLFGIVQVYVLNYFINPSDHVDYDRLAKSEEALKDLASVEKKTLLQKEERRRERADYKRFFGITKKKLVFYSESNGFYKYFRGIIEYLIENTNIVIHYITSDPNDKIFELAKTFPQIKPYFIGERKLITLMMKIEADIVVMTMPDIENYHIKRSYIDKNIEYIYIPHTLGSMNLVMRNACIDHYDTIFLTGKHQYEETRKTEKAYSLPEKKLVECGYPLLDDMIKEYTSSSLKGENSSENAGEKTILIAPSWQDDNIMDICIDEMLERFETGKYKVILRPHPQYIKHYPNRIEKLCLKYNGSSNITIQTDFSSNNTVFDADLVITDWSGIAYEYAYTTFKPVLFVNTPMKIMNPEYKRIDTVPINIWMRDIIGAEIRPDEMDNVVKLASKLIDDSAKYRVKIEEFVNEYVYNLGNSAEIGAKYIIESLKEKIKNRNAG